MFIRSRFSLPVFSDLLPVDFFWPVLFWHALHLYPFAVYSTLASASAETTSCGSSNHFLHPQPGLTTSINMTSDPTTRPQRKRAGDLGARRKRKRVLNWESECPSDSKAKHQKCNLNMFQIDRQFPRTGRSLGFFSGVRYITASHIITWRLGDLE